MQWYTVRRVGDVAQLGEHQVRNLGVESSILFVSTNGAIVKRVRGFKSR